MNILGYPVVGRVKVENERVYPLVDIPMMSDEEWNRLAGENAVNNFTRENGRVPENVMEAVKWQREWLARKEEVAISQQSEEGSADEG